MTSSFLELNHSLPHCFPRKQCFLKLRIVLFDRIYRAQNISHISGFVKNVSRAMSLKKQRNKVHRLSDGNLPKTQTDSLTETWWWAHVPLFQTLPSCTLVHVPFPLYLLQIKLWQMVHTQREMTRANKYTEMGSKEWGPGASLRHKSRKVVTVGRTTEGK